MIRILGLLTILGLFAYGWWYFTPHYFEVEETQEFVSEVTYVCNDEKVINAKFYQGKDILVEEGQPPQPNGSVNLILNNDNLVTLDQTISASGVRYANEDESFIFWTKGNTSFIRENDTETYSGCILVKPSTSELPSVYVNSDKGFSIRIPEGYKVDSSYEYTYLDNPISGVSFSAPDSLVEQTNLSSDTYISIETLNNIESCTADLFLEDTIGGAQNITENENVYSVAGFDDAAAGNRYEEIVYAIPGSFPCMGIRYFIHYGVFENYPEGTIKEFNKESLIEEFNKIRRSLIRA